jgi:lysozyme
METPVVWPGRADIFALAEPIIMEFEGFRSKPYLCPAGVPTIGYGTTKYPDGRKVTLADKPCAEVEARVYLEFSMRRVLGDLQASKAVARSPTVHQAAALLSLAYNVGVGAHDGVKGDLADSTLLARFNADDIQGAAAQFLVWNKARVNGVLTALSGLTKRRAAERALFETPDAPINHLVV